MKMPTDNQLSYARTYLSFANDALLLARFDRNKDWEYQRVLEHLRIALSHLDLQAVPLPPAGKDRSIGMTEEDAG